MACTNYGEILHSETIRIENRIVVYGGDGIAEKCCVKTKEIRIFKMAKLEHC